MSYRPTVSLLVLSVIAWAEAAPGSCPSNNMGTSNVIFLKLDGSHIKCENEACPGSRGYSSWADLCQDGLSKGWKMVSWKGSTSCFHGQGYTYGTKMQGGSEVKVLQKNGADIENVGSCTDGAWLDSQLTAEVCGCGVPRDSTSAAGATTSPRTTTSSRATTTTTTTRPQTTRATGEQSMPPVGGLFEVRFLELLPGGGSFAPMLLGASAGLALGTFGAVAVLRCRRDAARRQVAGHIYDPLAEDRAELGVDPSAEDRLLE